MAHKKQSQMPPNLEQLLKNKDREIANQESLVQNLKKEVNSLRSRLDADLSFEKNAKLENELKDAEKRN